VIKKRVCLGEVCKILDNLRKPITKKFRKRGEYPYYGATGIVDYVDDYIFDETLVLIGEDGAKWGKGEQTAFTVSGKYWVNNHAHVVRPLKDKLNHKFLVYYLNSIDLKPWVTGLTVPKLNQEKLKSIPIPLFSLEEQQRIVDKLDKVFTEIDISIYQDKQSLSKLSIIKSSILKNEFESNFKKIQLKHIVVYEKLQGKDCNLPYVGMENISSETMQIIGDISIPEKTSSTFRFNSSHVLFGRLRPYLKKVLIPDFEGQCSTEIFCLKPNKNIKKSFLAYWLLSPSISYKINNSSTGARMPRANMNELLNYEFPDIPITNQQKIINKIDLTFSLIEELRKIKLKKIVELKILKSSILLQEFKSNKGV
jgi:type I restriction enzyme S subunit